MAVITENDIELVGLAYLRSEGYTIINGPDIGPDGSHPERQYTDVVLVTRLRDAIDRLNPGLSAEAREEALKKVLRSNSPQLIANNERIHRYLTEGVDVEYRNNDGEIRGDIAYLIDFANPTRNEFLAINQFTIIEGPVNKRPDVVLFVNGLPLVVIELKNATDEKATIRTAYNQLQTYKQVIPSLFHTNALLIISDGWDARYGTLTSDYARFQTWKSSDNTETIPEMEVMLCEMLRPATLLDLIRHFIVFEQGRDTIQKKVAAYHQYRAVNKAIVTTQRATDETGDRRAGVVWHTQGSGKSLSMVFYTGKLVLALDNPTIVVLTDRNDLDDQLFDTFTACQQLLRQMPRQADSRQHLRQLLQVASGGIVFTTIQKFVPGADASGTEVPRMDLSNNPESNDKLPIEPELSIEPPTNLVSDLDPATYFLEGRPLSERRNIVVMADEAHRSQYDFIDGFAKHLHDALPNASFIGFTGTPIEAADKNTQAVFGKYVDIYDIQQAVDDGATVRIYYESRLAKVNFRDEEKVPIDEQFEELTERDELSERQKIKSRWTRLEAIVGNEHRLEKIAHDLIHHFEERTAVLEGKGMVVAMSRRICVDLYNILVRFRPEWHSDDDAKGAIKVIMTGSSSDPLPWQAHIRNKPRRKAIGERLKDPADPLKLVIVRDMWLTGFDAPCLHTLYVDKPMQGHNLMQAIARVNRVFREKSGGLVVDYLGIAQELKAALADYIASGGHGKPTLDQELAVAKMLEIHEAVCDQLRFFDFRRFFKLTPEEKLKFIPVIVDYILSQDNGEQSFTENVKNLLKAFAISIPHERAITIRDDVALFQAIKTRLVKIADRNEGRSDEELETAIKQIISGAITADTVVDVFDAAGIKKPSIEILDEAFLDEIQNMPQKNLAVELLKKLLKDEIKKRSKINLVQSKKFSEMLEDAIKRYHNGMIDTVEFLEKVLIPFSREIRESEKRGEALGLDYREFAFYSALEVSNNAVAILGNDVLSNIARELLDSVRNSTTVDWTIKESVQATLRRNIRRILRKHGYPPELQEHAVETVIDQAKLLAEDLLKR